MPYEQRDLSGFGNRTEVRTANPLGRHHALLMALTMFDRARWTGKEREADIFREWLIERLQEAGEEAGMAIRRGARR